MESKESIRVLKDDVIKNGEGSTEESFLEPMVTERF